MINILQSRWKQLLVALKLWWLGVWEAFQLQRCAVLVVLDEGGEIWNKLISCFVVNGGVFLGSIILHSAVVKPLYSWLLASFVEKLYGTTVVNAIQTLLNVIFQLAWLVPAYVVTLIISSKWYQEIALAAFAVRSKQPQKSNAASSSAPHLQSPHQPPSSPQLRAPSPAASQGSRAGGKVASSPIEDVAHEVYRGVFFLVFYMEVMLLAQIPYIGPPVNFIFLSWLYAYYCYDYLWSLQGVKLPERLAHFERCWAFFAGFGCPSVLATFCFSFYTGAALLALLFPLFILVATKSDPHLVHSQVPSAMELGRVPIFAIALKPTDLILRMVFGSVGKTHTQ